MIAACSNGLPAPGSTPKPVPMAVALRTADEVMGLSVSRDDDGVRFRDRVAGCSAVLRKVQEELDTPARKLPPSMLEAMRS